MEHDNNGKVQLNGSAIRRLREEQKLTQYYIAKVVGVTTDTVSRWENNRYPSVRRDNVLLLAEALDVPVEEILLSDDSPARRGRTTRSPLKVVLLVVSVILLLSVCFYYLFQRSAVVDYQLSVKRLLPPHASIATALPVRVEIDINGAIDGMVLRENFPKGFTLIEASPAPSSLDNIARSARWILPPQSKPLLVSYLLQADTVINAGQKMIFQGELIVHSQEKNNQYPVLGETELPADSYHWADANKDLRIDDGEALDASVMSIAMKNVHVDWELVEAIWDAGSYRLDPELLKFIPVRKEVTE